jgi:hypothetical protein
MKKYLPILLTLFTFFASATGLTGEDLREVDNKLKILEKN